MAATAAVFLLLKITGLTFRFSDGNIYLYMAKAIGEGFWPYRDFVLVDPPFLVFLLTALRALIRDHFLAYQVIPAVLEAGSSILLYVLLRLRGNKLSFLAPLLYLFSFTVLATSDYLTGVQLAVFLMLMAIFLYEKNKSIWSGVLWALAALTKLYVAPAILGFLIYNIWRKEFAKLGRIITGGALTTVVFLGPFLFTAPTQVYKYLWVMHFNRPAGLDKWNVWGFFVSHEWFLLATAAAGIYFCFKKTKLHRDAPIGKSATGEYLLWLFIPLLAFFLVYKDVYYLYLDSLLPYLLIFSFIFLNWLYEKDIRARMALAVVAVMGFSSLTGFIFNYYQVTRADGQFPNALEVAAYVKTLPPEFDLYGGQEMVSLVALLSGRKLFNNYIDTNAQIFATNTLDLEQVSNEAADKGVYLIGRLADHPELGIQNYGSEGYFAKDVFEKYCKEIKDFPNGNQELLNKIVIFKCSKN